MMPTHITELAQLPPRQRERVLRLPRLDFPPPLQPQVGRAGGQAESAAVLDTLFLRLQTQRQQEAVPEADVCQAALGRPGC